MKRKLILSIILVFGPSCLLADSAEVGDALRIIKEIGPEGQGNKAAAEAWKTLSESGGEAVIDILDGMNGAGDLPINWMRGALEVVVDRELNAGKALPLEN